MAFSRIVLARVLVELGRFAAGESTARAALTWFERWGRTHPKYVEAECELGRAQLLQGHTSEGRATLQRCLPTYRAWGQADRHVVASVARLIADGQ